MKKIQLNDIINKDNVNNFLFAIVLCAPMISYIVNINNIIPVIMLGTFLLLMIINRKTILKNKTINLFLLFFLVLFLIIIEIQLIQKNGNSFFYERLAYFLVFGVLSWLITSIYINSNNGIINIKKIINCLLILYAMISVFIYNTDFWKVSPRLRMAIGYYMLPLYVSIAVEFFIDKNKTLKKYFIKYIVYIIIYLPYFKFLIIHLPRGAVLGLIVSILLCILYRINTKQKIIFISALAILLCIIAFFALDILKFTQSVLSSLNISFSFIDKNVKLLEEGRIGDGRDTIYENAMKDIIKKPILGNGIGHFKLTYNTYPHNLVLQLWYEGGILFLLIFIIPIINSIVIIFFQKNKETNEGNNYFLIFLFGSCIIKLMMSQEFWNDIYFWIYMYMSFAILYEELTKRRNNYGKHSNTDIQKS